MGRPQQPELQRSGHTWVDPDHAGEVAAEQPPPRDTPVGRVPPENRPGHHADIEQDKPRRAPNPTPRRSAYQGVNGRQRFPFVFDARLAPLYAIFGVTPSRAYVEIDDELYIRFGPWVLRTALDNVLDLRFTGPYRWWRIAGPAHVSLADGGITFATTTAGGLCIRFRNPVPALLPTARVCHPTATVTLATPEAFAGTVAEHTEARGRPTGLLVTDSMTE